MNKRALNKLIILYALVCVLLVSAPENADAVPSFKRQTGQDCTACHTIFPELTPFGRAFKLTGYVMNKTGKSYPSLPPISAMAQFSYSRTDASLPQGSIQDTWSTHSLHSENDVLGSPQQLSLFYGGQVYGKVGAFVQGTYANDTNNIFMDAVDIRYANNTTLWDKDLIFGVTLNNSPTIEDVWNSSPAFSFPYASSNIAPTPAAATLIDNSLAAQVGGVGLYTYWNNMFYTAASVYRTANNGITSSFGANNTIDTIVDGAMPYWRAAFNYQYDVHSFTIGTYGLSGNVFAGPFNNMPTDHFTDVAIDGQYQYIQDRHTASLQATWIHEDQDRSGSFSLGNAANQSDSLKTFRITGNYYYRTQLGTPGGSVGFFSTTGDSDSLLYSPNSISGSSTGSPDSNGVILQLDYLAPWQYANTKVSLQYYIYNKFNGSTTDYDGSGRNASDNNTLYLLVWLAF
jgi:hypothetical protein